MSTRSLEECSAGELLEEMRLRQSGGYTGYAFVSTPEGSSRLGPRRELEEHSCSDIIARVVEIEKSVYGVDDRRDFFEIDDTRVLNNQRAVASLFVDSHVTQTDAGTFKLSTQPLKSLRDLCPGQAYAMQPTGAFGSGFLVAPDVIATAGHNTQYLSRDRMRCVFGFRMESEQVVQDEIVAEDVFSVVDVIAPEEIGRSTDWALLRLDRPVHHRSPLRIRMQGRVSDDTPVYIIGHPDGLPLKYAGGATVTGNDPGAIFLANLDAYGGNSGSPVFNAITHDVEGVLVGGAPDYSFNPETMCNEALHCPLDPTLGPERCTGESCLRVTEFAAHLGSGRPPEPTPGNTQHPPEPVEPAKSAVTSGDISGFAHNLTELLKGFLAR